MESVVSTTLEDYQAAIAAGDTGQKQSYGNILAVGVAVVAVVILTVNTVSADILSNKWVIGPIMGILAMAVLGATVAPILVARSEAQLKSQRSAQAHETILRKAELASEERIALIESGKLAELFESVGTMKVGTHTVKVYAEKPPT